MDCLILNQSIMAKRLKFNLFIAPLIDSVFAVVELLLGFRVILKFFGANPHASFVEWVYKTSQPLLKPFEGMFPTPVIEGNFVIEFSTLFALIVYGTAAYLLTELIGYVRRAGKETQE